MNRQLARLACASTAGVALTASGLAAWIAPAVPAAASARSGPAGVPAAFTFPGGLSGVAATSARNAWAVGISGRGTPLILH